MRRLQRKILLIPICFVLLRTPETVYRVLEYLHPSPAGGAVCEADASLASSVVGMVLQGMQAVTNPAAHRHYAWIEYLAVPGSVLEETVDRARPDEAWLAERAPALDSFKRSFDVADGDGSSSS